MCVAAAGWRQAIRTTSSRPQGPVWPRIVLDRAVVIAGIERITLLLRVDLAIARQGAGDLADVALGVVSLTQGEELEELAGEVLVGLGLRAVEPVEPAEHGPIAQDHAVQLADRCPPELAERQVLLEHQLGRVDLGLAGRVMRVPGQGHDLGQRVRREDQAIEPEHLDALDRGPPPRRVFHGGHRVGERRGRLAAGPLSLAFENTVDRRLEALGQVALELPPGRAEPGPAVQVGDARGVPGRLGARLIGLPGPARIIEQRRGFRLIAAAP